MIKRSLGPLAAFVLGSCLVSASADEATSGSHHGSSHGPSARHIVNLQSGSDVCPPGIAAFPAINRRVFADNTEQAFVIPEGKVLVVTDFAWNSAGSPPGTAVTLGLLKAKPGFGARATVTTLSAIADAEGRAAGSIHFTTGILVAPGITLCGNPTHPTGGPTENYLIFVTGYLVDAK